MLNKFHSANKKRWEAGASIWAQQADRRGTWRKCHLKPSLVLCDKERKYLSDLRGKQVCVLGSGDNQVAFALAGLGGKVTSVDISANQLAVAKERAQALGLSMSFVQSDVTNLSKLPDKRFDVVYTGGYVAPWVSDLPKYYSEAVRVLKPGGLFIVNEYHPFRLIWKNSRKTLRVEAPYVKRGPFEYALSENVLYSKAGSFKSFEFHWTIGDFVNCILRAGCELLEVDEYGDHVGDWEGAPMAGLPEILFIAARKRAAKRRSRP